VTATEARRARRRVRERALAAALVLFATLSSLAASRHSQAVAALRGARERLLAMDVAGAERAFREASAWRPTARLARAGLTICEAFDAPVAAAAALPGVVEWEPLLDGALRRRRFAAVVRLSELAGAAGDARAPLFRAAALLELGRVAEARALASANPAFASHGLGRRIAEALAARAAGALTLVRERSGELIGWFDAGGAFTSLRDQEPLPAPLFEAQALAGRSGVRVSLDLELSRAARDALGDRRGSIVLVDVHTGALLAAVTDRRTARREPLAPLTQRREPASIAKIITTAAAVRAGLDPDAEIAQMTCRGHERYGDGVLWCSTPAGPLGGLNRAMAISCNTAFASLAMRVGRPALVDELRRWGFDRQDGGAFGYGRVLGPAGGPRQLADLSVGLTESDVTPVHAALLAAVVGNGGALPRPGVGYADDGELGLTPHWPSAEPAGERVLDADAVATLRRSMEAVVAPGGTAASVAHPGFPVAMKTGTAAQPGAGYHVNYMGYGPLPAPDLAFCVRITHQPTSHHASRSGREATRALVAALAGLRTRALTRSVYAPAAARAEP
jgi:peptidoglycan glycosyltransferase